ncbi:MAG: hypothetical protein ACE5FT_01505 [Candidatus Nanoarchaeia archaeon]
MKAGNAATYLGKTNNDVHMRKLALGCYSMALGQFKSMTNPPENIQDHISDLQRRINLGRQFL